MKINKCKGYKQPGKNIMIKLSHEAYKELPDLFYADVTIENIAKREKQK